jgi:DNA-binding LacI/PurR family transcriptional regulator
MGMTDATKTLVDALVTNPGVAGTADENQDNHAAHHQTIHAALKEVYGDVKRYRANLLINGASVSIETEIKNTLGATVTASHAATGDYRLTASAAVFTTGKTFVPGVLDVQYAGADQWIAFTTPPPSTTVLQIRVLQNGAYADGSFRIPIMIEVYP